ncbi:exportin-1-like [Dorcoceras hygrometricum]|uniref:Exportin-1-like n=1 Tax=Dorcoceras hygrometricum TaxID=472368 RepID=A0A2Z7CQ75_9LAMI|nr:exportin-1-like [Dorcoceras hygrometricum]
MRSWKRPREIPELFLQNPGVTSDLSEARRVGVLGPRPEEGFLRQPALEGLTRSARTDSPRRIGRNEFRRLEAAAAACERGEGADMIRCLCELNGSGIQLAVSPQPLWLRNHNSGLAHRIMVKRLATSPHDPLGITDSACKNQLVVVSVQYGPFNPYIPIRSTTIGKSRVAIDPIAMHTSWRSNSDIVSVTRADIDRGKLWRRLLYRIDKLLRSRNKIKVTKPVLIVKTSEPVAIQYSSKWIFH